MQFRGRDLHRTEPELKILAEPEPSRGGETAPRPVAETEPGDMSHAVKD